RSCRGMMAASAAHGSPPMFRPVPILAASLAFALLLAGAPPAAARAGSATATDRDALATEAERSGFLRTGRYPEVIALCEAFVARHPDAVRCIDFGTTPE